MVSPRNEVIEAIGKAYAGRASSSPIVDLFITLLSMGLSGYQHLLQNRVQIVDTFVHRLGEVAKKHGERLLVCPDNTISFGITLDGLGDPRVEHESERDYLDRIRRDVTQFGAMLFTRCVSGTRVVPRCEVKTMNGHNFQGYGSSVDDFPHAYLTAACAIGVSTSELDEFLTRLDKTFVEYRKKKNKNAKYSPQN